MDIESRTRELTRIFNKEKEEISQYLQFLEKNRVKYDIKNRDLMSLKEPITLILRDN